MRPASDLIFLSFLPHSWDYRHMILHLACLLMWGLHNFLPGLDLNLNPPSLHLQSSWELQVCAITPSSANILLN
jgi:hypothetical protein